MENNESKCFFVIKKDGTKEKFDINKVVNAVKKSAQRVLINFTEAQINEICSIVEKDVEDCGKTEILIHDMHNIVEAALEGVNPKVGQSYRNYRNYKQDFAFESVGGIESVSKSTLYSVLQLVSLPVKQVEATVTAIDYQNKTVTVQSQFELQLVRFNEYTEGAKIQDLTVGERIIVEYDFLFEKYDPVSVFANCVTVKTGGELQ